MPSRLGAVVAVEVDVVPVDVVVRDRLESGVTLQAVELRRRHPLRGVHRSRAQVLGHRVRVGVRLEDDLVDLGTAPSRHVVAPVVRVAHQLRVVPALVVRHLERPAADDRRLVGVAALERRDLDLAPDVLGDDVDDHVQHVRLGRRHGEPHRGVVHRLRVLDVLDRLQVRGQLVVDDQVVAEGDVGGGERLPVLPLHAGSDVDGPREAVGGDAAVLLRGQLGRELRDRLAVEAEPEQPVVGEVQDLGRGRLDPDERAQVVGVRRPADAQRTGGGGRRCRPGSDVIPAGDQRQRAAR